MDEASTLTQIWVLAGHKPFDAAHYVSADRIHVESITRDGIALGWHISGMTDEWAADSAKWFVVTRKRTLLSPVLLRDELGYYVTTSLYPTLAAAEADFARTNRTVIRLLTGRGVEIEEGEP